MLASTLGAFMDAACQVIPRYYPPQCCLAAARIATEVLARRGIVTRPLVVRAVVHNAALVQKGRAPASDDEARRWREQDRAAMAVCGGKSMARPGHWAGHLVVIAQNEYLIDLSLPQMNCPDLGIMLTAVLTVVQPAFLAGQEAIAFPLKDCRVHYDAFPDDHSFVALYGWEHVPAHHRAIEEIARLMPVPCAFRS